MNLTETLFREHRERMARFAKHLVGSGADADDLVQETFLKVHNYLRNGREIQAPLSFLFVTMRNLVNDANRQRKTGPVEASLDEEYAEANGEAPSAEREAMSQREFERLCIAIAQLPERMRHAFVLRKVYGYSCREIAERLGRSTNTVRGQVAQGFKKLCALEVRGPIPDKDKMRGRDKAPGVTRGDEPSPLVLPSVARREGSG